MLRARAEINDRLARQLIRDVESIGSRSTLAEPRFFSNIPHQYSVASSISSVFVARLTFCEERTIFQSLRSRGGRSDAIARLAWIVLFSINLYLSLKKSNTFVVGGLTDRTDAGVTDIWDERK